MFDASKAFDIVHFYTLFRLLLKSTLPLGKVRLLLDSFTRSMYIQYGNGIHPRFIYFERVRHGGVISPSMFTIIH